MTSITTSSAFASALVVFGLLAAQPALGASAVSTSPVVRSGDSGLSAADPKAGAVEGNKEAIVPDDTAASRNAARTRMRECGHQWSSMKKTGSASGMTWKEFSQGCLARK